MTTQVRGAGVRPWRGLRWGAAGALLLVPLAAMQVSDEVNWTAADFLVAGAMLAVVLGGYELLASRSGDWARRGGAAVALAAAFLLLFVNGAVGLIGSERDDANLLFGLVLLTAGSGAALARFRASGMAWAMLAAAAVQVIVPLAIWAGRLTNVEPARARDVALTIALFTPLWLGAAWLFARAARRDLAAAGNLHHDRRVI